MSDDFEALYEYGGLSKQRVNELEQEHGEGGS